MEFGDRQLFHIKQEKIYSQDKIGIVGPNGAGKTTLMEILASRIEPVGGNFTMNVPFVYIPQLTEYENNVTASREFKMWKVPKDPKSGGEVTRKKIASALSGDSQILLCDEPTSNLDQDGVEKLEKTLKRYDGTVIIISHDRALLDTVCNKIWEINDGEIKVYNGNYSEYRHQRDLDRKIKQDEYDNYVEEKKHLEKAISNRTRKSKSMTRAPKRMGIGEASLHKLSVRQKAGKVEQASKQLTRRLERLEVKEKPKNEISFKMTVNTTDSYINKNVIRVEDLNFYYDDKMILDNVYFNITKGEKIAITGNNGSGKSTLLNCIYDRHDGVYIPKGVDVGYFRQNTVDLDDHNTILESVKKYSTMPEYMTRIVLARLGIRREDVYKKIGILSGGERCKVSLATLICRRCPVLLLDEPTNYLDIYVLEALEDMLSEFDGTLVFVSHDRYFREKIATREVIVKDNKIEEKIKAKPKTPDSTQKMLLEMEKTDLICRLTSPRKGDVKEELEKRYQEVCELLR